MSTIDLRRPAHVASLAPTCLLFSPFLARLKFAQTNRVFPHNSIQLAAVAILLFTVRQSVEISTVIIIILVAGCFVFYCLLAVAKNVGNALENVAVK